MAVAKYSGLPGTMPPLGARTYGTIFSSGCLLRELAVQEFLKLLTIGQLFEAAPVLWPLRCLQTRAPGRQVAWRCGLMQGLYLWQVEHVVNFAIWYSWTSLCPRVRWSSCGC